MLTAYLLFASRNPAACEVAREAVGRVDKNARLIEAESMDEALKHKASGGEELAVLIEPGMEEMEMALKAAHANGMPRWAVTGLGGAVESTSLEVVASSDWNAPLLAKVFRSALQNQVLRTENSRLRGDMLTVARRISHDLRTPLSGIFTTAELLKEILADQSEEDAALTEPLFDSSQAVLRLIERVSFLMKASVEAPAREPVDMAQVLWAARQGVERQIMQKGIRFAEPESWPEVSGVAPWLEAVWSNLLSNAAAHAGQGGAVTVGWRDLEDCFEFSVEDNGAGVPAEKRGGLYRPFETLHLIHSGKGLGLPTVERLVHLLGGSCGYEERPGGGSRFLFTLPKAAQEATANA